MPAAMNEMSSWFVASTEREIQRVSEIAKEMGIASPKIDAKIGLRSHTRRRQWIWVRDR